MDKQSLIDRRTEAARRFDELVEQRNGINAELSKLQGQWQMLGDLITAMEEAEPKTAAEPQVAIQNEGTDASTNKAKKITVEGEVVPDDASKQ